jgi:hypothetical protein
MHTFVCQIVSEVDVITAKRCPVRDILSDRRGSFSADPAITVSFPVDPVMNRLSCSTGLIPGVMGVIGVRGVDKPDAPSFSSSAFPAAPMLGASTRDPLPSVVSRDSVSSSDSSMRSLEDLLLLAA